MRAATERLSFAIALESERKYILYLPSVMDGLTGTLCTQAWVFDTVTRAWVRWTKPSVHGLSNPDDDRLYLVNNTRVLRQRKEFTRYDYVDESEDIPLVGFNDGAHVLISNNLTLTPGDLLLQGDVWGIVLDYDGTVATLDRYGDWAPGTVTHYKAIPSVVEWVPRFSPPGFVHRFIEVALSFRELDLAQASVAFIAATGGTYAVPVTMADVAGLDHPSLRVIVPREVSVSPRLRLRWEHAQGWCRNRLQGLSIISRPGTAPIRRAIAPVVVQVDDNFALDQPLEAPLS
jgi:hypothetical protein